MYVPVMPASAYTALAFVFGFIQINWRAEFPFSLYYIWRSRRDEKKTEDKQQINCKFVSTIYSSFNRV